MPLKGNKYGKGLDKNPQNINKKGVPKKVITTLLDYCEKHYGKRPQKAEVISLMEYIECLPVEQLALFIEDTSIPAIVQAYGRLLLKGDTKDFRKVQAAEMINDRIHGKPKQSTQIGLDETLTSVKIEIIRPNDK